MCYERVIHQIYSIGIQPGAVWRVESFYVGRRHFWKHRAVIVDSQDNERGAVGPFARLCSTTEGRVQETDPRVQAVGWKLARLQYVLAAKGFTFVLELRNFVTLCNSDFSLIFLLLSWYEYIAVDM